MLDDQADGEDSENGDGFPMDGDLATEDFNTFFEIGSSRRHPVLTVATDDDWRHAVRAYFDTKNFWPNVWSISDHGNVELLDVTSPT